MNTRGKQSNSRQIEEDSSVSSSASSDNEESTANEEQKSTSTCSQRQCNSATITATNTTSKREESNIIVRTTSNILLIAYDASKIYLLWAFLHFCASQLYVPTCSPYSFWGFIITPILAVTPQCKALRWVISTGGSTMETMWVILGVWLCSKISMPYSSWTNNSNNKPRVSVSLNNNRDRARSYDHIHPQKD
jgi:hypothetical protein